ncbi:hypothetical protein Amet_1720 [Alkaliphilus metalliredigens QYMF]|uniref:DUF2140 family protein n=1 Tax=Alkaliphilus metalliredigens (strain QYMF) TaxID=293826 RepID=A6TNX8_ALKMQ|nr:hypothetical protein [Alkaliphilus metalliredigens]ABR47896.1 hypothetical protein Amet_1720 [Alkaliphilus metalliredigens QYMF]
MKKVFIMVFIIIVIFIGIITAFTYPIPSEKMATTIQYDEFYLINKITSNNIQFLEQNSIVITEEELNGFMTQQVQSQLTDYLPNYFKLEYMETNLLQGQILISVYGRVQVFPVRLQFLLNPAYSDGTLYAAIEEVYFSKFPVPSMLYPHFLHLVSAKGLDGEKDTDFIEIPLPTVEMINITHLEFEENRVVIYYQFNLEQIISRFLNRFDFSF